MYEAILVGVGALVGCVIGIITIALCKANGD